MEKRLKFFEIAEKILILMTAGLMVFIAADGFTVNEIVHSGALMGIFLGIALFALEAKILGISIRKRETPMESIVCGTTLFAVIVCIGSIINLAMPIWEMVALSIMVMLAISYSNERKRSKAQKKGYMFFWEYKSSREYLNKKAQKKGYRSLEHQIFWQYSKENIELTATERFVINRLNGAITFPVEKLAKLSDEAKGCMEEFYLGRKMVTIEELRGRKRNIVVKTILLGIAEGFFQQEERSPTPEIRGENIIRFNEIKERRRERK